MLPGLPLYLFGFFGLNFPLYDINNYIVYITIENKELWHLKNQEVP